MTRSRRIAGIALAATLLSTAVIATTATAANAHTPSASATCESLTVNLQSYSTSANDREPNAVTVTIDDSVIVTEEFGASFTREFDLGIETQAHEWSVEIDAVDNAYDRDFTGTSTPCDAIPRDAAAAVTSTLPTCTEPGTLVLESATNASWSTPTITEGPGEYLVTATATTDHYFDDGSTTREFTGTLPDTLDPTSAECQPEVTPVVVPPRPLPTEVSSQTVTDDCETTTRSITTTRTTTDWTLNPAGDAWIPATPVVTVTTTTETIDPQLCPAVDPTDEPPVSTDPAGETPDTEEPMVGGIFYYVPSSLAHSGTDSVLPITIALTMLVAGAGIHLLRRRIRTNSN